MHQRPLTSVRRTPLPCADAATSAIPLCELRDHFEDWLLDGKVRGHSPETRKLREWILARLERFLQEASLESVGTRELKRFFAALQSEDEDGKKVRPWTAVTYHQGLKAFFAYLVREGVLPTSPMDGVPRPLLRQDQIQPFSPEQVGALIAAAKKSKYPRRDLALLLVLFDTGTRASEVCAFLVRDLDLAAHRLIIRGGKGNKDRVAVFGRETQRAIRAYLRSQKRQPEDPPFGSEKGGPMTRSGLLQFMSWSGWAGRRGSTRCGAPRTRRGTRSRSRS